MKVTGPMLSFSASGTIGGTATFATWKGRPYVRQTVIPSNPKSPGQVAQRAMMKFLAQGWAGLATPEQSSWYALSQAGNFSPFNAFTKFDLGRYTRLAMPTQDPTTIETTDAGTTDVNNVTPEVRAISVSWVELVENDNWGVVLYAKLGGNPVGTKNEVINVQPMAAVSTYSFLHNGLVTGEHWYYAVMPFSKTGKSGILNPIGDAIVL